MIFQLGIEKFYDYKISKYFLNYKKSCIIWMRYFFISSIIFDSWKDFLKQTMFWLKKKKVIKFSKISENPLFLQPWLLYI